MLLFTAFLMGAAAHAADLKAPFELETTKVLPKKVRNPRIKNLFMDVTSRYNGIGQLEPLGQKLNKVVTFNDLVESKSTQEDKDKVKGLYEGAGFAADQSPGSTSGVVNSYANVKVPVFAIGVTEKLTMAVAVPVMDIQVSADTGFIKDANGDQFVAAAEAASIEKGIEARNGLNNAINEKLKRLGYEQIPAFQQVKGVGDVKLVGKYLLRNEERIQLAVKGEVTFPTGRAPNADKVIDPALGDGQWDVGAAAIYDYKLLPDLRWNTYGGYVAQLPASLDRRLPKSATDSLSSDKEYLLRDLGDIVTTGTSLSYEFPAVGMMVGAGYTFQYLTKTTYRDGANPDKNRYRLLENEYPYQALHSATLMTGFSTVEWFKAKKFVYPFQANVAYSRPITGRNVTSNEVVAAELVLFF
jgi:hypothetical protein